MEWHAAGSADFGALHWRDWYAEGDRLRTSAGRLIGGEPAEIALLKNTSEALSFVAQGYRWERGDNVITTHLEFPSNYTRGNGWSRAGVECRIAPLPTVEAIEPLIDAKTRIVTVSSVAFHNGFTADLDAIGELCARARGAVLCRRDSERGRAADRCAQVEDRVPGRRRDKWMCGPETVTIFYAAAEHRDKLEVLESGWTNVRRGGRFIECDYELLPDARRFEAGSLNTNGIYGLRAAIDLLLEIGIKNIAREVIAIATKLANRLDAIGWRVASPRPIASGIIGAIPPAVEPSLLKWHRLLERGRHRLRAARRDAPLFI